MMAFCSENYHRFSGEFCLLVNDLYEIPGQSLSLDHNGIGATARAAAITTTSAASGDATDSACRRRGSGGGSHGTGKRDATVENRDGQAERPSAATGRDDLPRSRSLRAAIQRVFQAGRSLQGK